MTRTLLIGTALATLLSGPAAAQSPTNLLNASYDIARELFEAINPVFVEAYEAESGTTVTVDQSHAGSSRQARAIAEGLEADVVTFNQVTDVAFLETNGFIEAGWQEEFPNNASPFFSLPAFLVREGNPKGIENWDDLVAEGVEVIFPNPKTSGNARYTYLAARAYAIEAFDGDEAQVDAFIEKLFDNVPVFDTGGRAATATFVEREIGDVLITFEAEVQQVESQFGADRFDIVIPEVSLLAEFPVAVVDRVAERRGSAELANAYLEFLFSDEGQRIAAENGHRVENQSVLPNYAERFPEVRLVTVEDVFGGWDQAQSEHFASGGKLDQLYGQR